VIPYYNKGLFSPIQVLRSIQNQSFKDIEIIFVDDGSSILKIKEILEEMKDDNRIILLRHKKRKTILIYFIN
jgi:glycosyltransferase involved in cell wall biosynthesis